MEMLHWTEIQSKLVAWTMHTAPEAAALVFAATKPGLAVSFHAMVAPGTPQPLFDRLRAGYDGPFLMAQDFTVISVTPEQIVTRMVAVRARAAPGTPVTRIHRIEGWRPSQPGQGKGHHAGLAFRDNYLRADDRGVQGRAEGEGPALERLRFGLGKGSGVFGASTDLLCCAAQPSRGLPCRGMRGPQFTPLGVVAVLFTIAVALAVFVNGDFGWLAAVIAIFVIVGVIDFVQARHSVRRNYPLFGRLRWVGEEFRPETQQYFVEQDTEGKPFDRTHRSLVYQRGQEHA